MLKRTDRARLIERTNEHPDRAEVAQDGAGAPPHLAAEYQKAMAEMLRREVARQIG
jgi:hypothetical protein